jgi:hypothetical protein
MKRIMWFCFVAVFSLCWGSGEARAARNWQSLRNVQGMEVVIADLNPEAVQDGLTVALLHTDVVRALNRAGIQVFTREQRLRSPGAPWLYVSVSTVRTKLGAHVYSVSVALFQDALLRSNGITTTVQTWERGAFGMTRSPDLRKIREALVDLVRLFVKDYLAMNPE